MSGSIQSASVVPYADKHRKEKVAEFPEKLQALFLPKRYKILFGGRGGSKSWTIARILLTMGTERPLRIACARAVMKSLKDSVHKLLSDQIKELGLEDFYEIQINKITGRNGTEFTFYGLNHDIDKIRSLEAIDIFWVEEAHAVTGKSWDILIPTIRRQVKNAAGEIIWTSEIWISFNPELDTDETYKRFVLNPPEDSYVINVNWRDNPFFNELMNKERLLKRKQDYDGYLTTWEGKTRQTLDGAIFANEIRSATMAGRITKVPYNPTVPVWTFWDIGRADSTSIWFAQIVGFEFHIIDFYEDRQHHIDHYMQVLRDKGYSYLHHWLPHDAQAKTIGTKLSVEEQMKAKGFPVRIVANLSVADGINAARTMFPMCYFDEVKCADGLNHLRRYQYEVDTDTRQFSDKPLHNESSHACLIAGELVNTTSGLIPIEQVKVGVVVWTPSGISRVIHAGPVKVASDLIEIHSKSGRLLTCTPEHKILTKRGFVAAGELLTSDRILTGMEWNSRLIGFISMALSTSFRGIITGETFGVRKGPQIFIEPFMPLPMGGYRKIGFGMKSLVNSAISCFARLILSAPNSAIKIAELQRVDCAKEGKLVFDLTVEKNKCYQANGVLVSNSDAFRYLSLGLREREKRVKKALPSSFGQVSPTGWMG